MTNLFLLYFLFTSIFLYLYQLFQLYSMSSPMFSMPCSLSPLYRLLNISFVMLVRGILLAVYDTSVLPYTKWRMRIFFSPMDNIYIWIDQAPNLEMQLGDLSSFWRLWLLKCSHWQYVEGEHDGWVVYTNALYSGDPELKSQPRDWLSWLKFFIVFFGSFREVLV